MLYKPNFCCNCGEKIERVDWHLTVSRRFCDVCSIEHRRHDYIPRIAVASGVLALMFGLGSLWGGSGAIEYPSSRIAPAALKSSIQNQTLPNPQQQESRAVPQAESQGESAIVSTPPADVAGAERKSTESKFFCGALTKKGTPCSRKVRSRGVRCYQHEGRPEAPPMN
jgi:hypothetical protein